MMTSDSVTATFASEFARRDFEAWNAHDAASVVNMTTPDVVLEGPFFFPTGRIEGRDQYRRWLISIWSASPDWHIELYGAPFVSKDCAQAAWAWKASGTMLGRLDPPGFSATGGRIELVGIDVWEFRGGLGSHLRTYSDSYWLAVQVGALPPHGARAERVAIWLQRIASMRMKTKLHRRVR